MDDEHCYPMLIIFIGQCNQKALFWGTFLFLCIQLFCNLRCRLLPPATKLRQGNVFTSVCQEFCPRGGHAWQGGAWHVWQGRGACVAGGGHSWQGVHGKGGACVAGGHAWQDSSRMCTICSSGCWGGTCPSMHWAKGRGMYPSMHWAGGVCPGGMSVQGGVCPSACWDTPPPL